MELTFGLSRSPSSAAAVAIISGAFMLFGCGGRSIEHGDASDAGMDANTDAGFNPQSYCPSSYNEGEIESLIPRPFSVRDTGDAGMLSGKTVSVEGETPAFSGEIASLSGTLGLERVAAGGALTVRIHPLDRFEQVRQACGLPVVAGPEAYILNMDAGNGLALADLFGAGDPGVFYALKTLRQLISTGGNGTVSTTPAFVFDYPSSPMRGVLEGFYGPPWDAQTRLFLLARYAGFKMNYFIYAPKDDLSINLGWRNGFQPEEFKYIRQMAAEGKKQRIRVCWEIHPGNLITFSSPSDFELLMGKFRVIAAQGIDCFILAFDDIMRVMNSTDEKAYGSLIEAHVDLANRVAVVLHGEHPGALLGFVPMDYFTEAEGTALNMPYLGKNLSMDWEVAWTGRKVISPIITTSDAVEIGALIGRRPLLGDNFPVADLGNITGILNLGPLIGRDPALQDAVGGFVFNAMPFPWSSLPALATAADYAWNPAGYSPERSIKAASFALAGTSGAGALETLCMADQNVFLSPSPAPGLDAAIDAYWKACDTGVGIEQAEAALRGFFISYSSVPGGLASSAIIPELLDEVRPWAEKLGTYGLLGGTALDLLKVKKSGGTPDQVMIAELESGSTAVLKMLPKPCGKSMDDFLGRALSKIK
jgi:hypothetical protein